jgi:hypothetical protein
MWPGSTGTATPATGTSGCRPWRRRPRCCWSPRSATAICISIRCSTRSSGGSGPPTVRMWVPGTCGTSPSTVATWTGVTPTSASMSVSVAPPDNESFRHLSHLMIWCFFRYLGTEERHRCRRDLVKVVLFRETVRQSFRGLVIWQEARKCVSNSAFKAGETQCLKNRLDVQSAGK